MDCRGDEREGKAGKRDGATGCKNRVVGVTHSTGSEEAERGCKSTGSPSAVTVVGVVSCNFRMIISIAQMIG